MSMTDSQFRHLVKDALQRLFDQIDDLPTDDIDPMSSDGVIDVCFEDDSHFVLSQQVPTRELWLSANLTAWHFNWDGERWLERNSREEMLGLLNRLFSEKLGMPVRFTL